MEAILNYQNDLHLRISKAYSNFKKSPKDRITKQYLEGRLEMLEQLWCAFMTGHKDFIHSSNAKTIKETDYSKSDIYEQTEATYMDYKIEMKTNLASFTVIEAKVNMPLQVKTNHVKLPKISIPNFSGKYLEWVTFRDLFQSLIHGNDNLDDVEKLHYLKGFLVGEAEQLIRHIAINSANYKKCWDLLVERYNNKKYICHHILKRLFSQRNLTIESAVGIKELIDNTNDCLSSLSGLGIDVSSWDVIVIHMITLKLDPESRKQWEFHSSSTSIDALPTYIEFKEFLTNRYRALEFIGTKVYSGPRIQGNQNNIVSKMNSLHVANVQCPFCSDEHRLGFCKNFAKETVDSRRNFVQTNNVCFNCLGSNHSAIYCTVSARCRVCKKKHHSLLHPKGKVSSEAVEVDTETPPPEKVVTFSASEDLEDELELPSPGVSCFSSGRVYNQVLLATALVKAMSKTGTLMIRALLDQGSQSSFITESTVQLLGLKKTPARSQISGLGGDKKVTTNGVVDIEVVSRINPKTIIKVKAYVLKSITGLLPVCKMEAVDWPELSELVLADPDFQTPNKIDLLLGAEIYAQIIEEGVKKSPFGSTVAQATSLGWILSGVVSSSTNAENVINVMHCQVDENEILKRFWELESDVQVPKEKMYNEAEKQCEEIYAKTTRRDEQGRYIVKLPMTTENPQVHGSFEIAMKRLKLLERRLDKDFKLKEQYSEVFNDYIHQNHMERVPKEELNKSSAIYLPHHPVIRQDKDTTKVRVVFDASCKGTNNKSLNDNMLIGPTLQPDLRHLIMKFRTHPVCLVADIEKMYRQIKVEKIDADLQRLLWREGEEVQIFRLSRVTFGTASAPYLAVRSLQQAARDEGVLYPTAAEIILKDFYMDDLMTGCQTWEQGIALYSEINEILNKAGFKLQKWSSNNEKLLEEIKQRELEIDRAEGSEKEIKEGMQIKMDSVIKILGLTWNRCDDSFRYVVKLPTLQYPVTKRKIISDIARFYDPLGWVGPSIIVSKIIIQKLWLVGILWDETVPDHILNEWLTYREELIQLSQLTIPRWIQTKTNDLNVELHGFCDASKVAYAAAVYVRVIDCNNKIHIKLISSKTKVAPVKQVSIPRLELCGAVLLTKLIIEIAKVLGIEKQNIHAWTDSTVVLAWINSHPSKWKVFVANRVTEIITNLDSHNWAHISSGENPADGASRGLRPSELIKKEAWFNGPEFLSQEIIHYNKSKNVTTNVEEVKVHCTTTVEVPIWEKFSSLTKLVRVRAYCTRFIRKLKKVPSNQNNYLTTKELADALRAFVAECQASYFKSEIAVLKKKENLPKSSCLRALNPFIGEEDQLLRVGGRLEYAQFDESRKHPIIIPRSSHLANLIVADAHKQTLHGGPQLMMCYIQSKYWILGAKQLVRSHFRKCVICAKSSAITQSQLMGQLPSARLTPSRPFKSSGVDYAGPIQIRTAKGRGHKSHKGYICLFICMVTRAVHLEIVSDLTSEGFLQAFKRFVARRGCCTDLWSDNGTNFIGAARELKSLFKMEQESMIQEVAESLATQGCNWHFIPARSPNFGGLWEAGVKSVKYHLKRVIGQSTLTYEEMATVLTQIEACLNSRPLSVLNEDAHSVTVLTPGHFLVGEPLVTLPDKNFETSNIGSLRRWQYTQRMLQDFWRFWSKEYLTRFYNRYRWSSLQPQIKIGDLVIIKEDHLPPCNWLYGRVVATHPGSDDIIRVVTLKTKTGTLKRPITKLCLLPVSD